MNELRSTQCTHIHLHDRVLCKKRWMDGWRRGQERGEGVRGGRGRRGGRGEGREGAGEGGGVRGGRAGAGEGKE